METRNQCSQQPRASLTKCDPRNPEPPVTSTRVLGEALVLLGVVVVGGTATVTTSASAPAAALRVLTIGR